jgi:hypothetical protein
MSQYSSLSLSLSLKNCNCKWVQMESNFVVTCGRCIMCKWDDCTGEVATARAVSAADTIMVLTACLLLLQVNPPSFYVNSFKFIMTYSSGLWITWNSIPHLSKTVNQISSSSSSKLLHMRYIIFGTICFGAGHV